MKENNYDNPGFLASTGASPGRWRASPPPGVARAAKAVPRLFRQAGAGSGCGSGILSIAALVLGASAAAAVDIDPKAVDVAYENAALNGIGRDRYNVRAGNVLTDGAWWPSWPGRSTPWCWPTSWRRDHTPVRQGGGVPGHGRGVPVLRHHRHPGRRGGGRPGAEWPWPCLSGGSRTAGWPWRPCGPVAEFKRGVRASRCAPPSLSKGMTRNPPCGFWRTAL